MDEGSPANGAGRVGAYHHGNLKAALIAVARDMLERDGPEALSLRAVAQAAGVSRTAPYNHFDDKEALLAALAGAGFRALADAQSAAAEAVDGAAERLVAIGRSYVGFALAHPQLYRLMYGVGVSDWCRHPGVRDAKRASFEPVQAALAEHLGSGADPHALRVAAVAAWAEVHGLSMLLLDGSLGDDADVPGETTALVDTILATFVAGLRHG